MGNNFALQHQNPAIIAILLITTCSIYYFFLLYSWTKAVNSVSDQPRLDPTLTVILSILTCGLASIYFEYEVASRAEKIIQKKKELGRLRDDGMMPPVDNLKNIALYGNLASYAIAIFSAGLLYIISIVFTLWLCCSIQYALEYALDTPQD